MLIGSLVLMGGVLLVTKLAQRWVGEFNDAYAARFGGIPSRAELAKEREGDPLATQRRLFAANRLRIADIYLPLADPSVEPYRRRAALAMNGIIAFLVLATPVGEVIDAVTGGPALSAHWPWLTLLRVAFLVIFATWLIQWLVALRDRRLPAWWRALCLVGMIGALVAFFVVRFMH